MDWMLLIWTGLVAGSLHVVSGPDHLMALAPIAVQDRVRAMRLGGVWGLGHGVGVAALGGLGLLAGHALDVSMVSAWSEFAVGLALVLVGAWSLRRSRKVVVHGHGHSHDHDHAHDHDESEHHHWHVHNDKKHDERAHKGHSHAAFGVGFLHGTAGTGHLFGVIPALALSPSDAAVYIAAYLVSAVVSMALFGGGLGQIIARGGEQGMKRLMAGSGVAAIGLGIAWASAGWPL
jgi:ABC-type nickel/cobalt efflux system permease component RcnA